VPGSIYNQAEKEHKTMSSLEKPSRRALVKWGLVSTGLPLVSQALVPVAEGKAKPDDNGARGGSTVSVLPGLQMFYREEWFGAPWLKPEPAILLHGNQETGEIWYGWVPRMAQHFRLFRLDLPGFGRSTVPSNFEWSLANFAKVVANFLDRIGVESAHIIGAKTGGAIAMQFAATYPQRTRTLVVASGPFSSVDPRMESSSQQVRLGSAASKEEMEYFDKMKDATSPETRRGVRTALSSFNLESLLPRITARTLIITSDRSALQSVETVLRYQPKIPNSRLLVLTSDAYHVAVANADECVTNVLAFIQGAKQQT
jgi:3-oxoadipate enol-lactonase